MNGPPLHTLWCSFPDCEAQDVFVVAVTSPLYLTPRPIRSIESIGDPFRMKIKAHPRRMLKRHQQQQRRRPLLSEQSAGRSSSSSSKSDSFSSEDDDSCAGSSRVDSLALIGGNGSGRKQKMTSRITSQAAARKPKQQQTRGFLNPLTRWNGERAQPMSILEDLDTNGAMAPPEKRKNSTRTRKPLAAVGAASTSFGGAGRRPKKPVGDLLAGSLMANLSLDDGGGPSYRPLARNRNAKSNHQQRSKKQLYYARGGVPSVAAPNSTTSSGLLSSLLVACSSTTDVAAVQQQQQGRLPQRPKGYALKLAYAAAGKTYRPASTALRLENLHRARRSTRNIQESSLVAVTNGDESSTLVPNMHESRPAPKAKNKQLGLVGGDAAVEKRVAFAVETSIAPSHKEREQKHQKDTGGGLLSLFRGEASAGESSGSDAKRKARLSMLSLGTIGSDQASQDSVMLSSPSPQSKTNEDLSLVRSLELCQLKAIHVADDPTSRKRIEVASPELKVDPKRRDQKKTPGKNVITAAEAAQEDVAQHTTSSTPVLAPSLSENVQLQPATVEQVKKSGPNKARVSARMIIDLDESLSDLSDDDQLDNMLPTASLHSTSPQSIQSDSTDQMDKILPPATLRSMSLQLMQKDSSKKDAIASQLDLSDSNKVNEMPLTFHEPTLPPPPMQPDSLMEESRMSHGTDAGSETARSLLGEEYVVNMSLGNPKSPAKEADASQPAAAAAAVVEARRSQRDRTVTDRFTIAAHTAGGHYVPPQHLSKGGQIEQGRSAKSKQAPKPQRQGMSNGPKESTVGPGTVADSGEDNGLGRWDNDSLSQDDDAPIETRKKTSRPPKTKPAPRQRQEGKGGGDEEAEAEPTIRNKNSINNERISSANVWRSRRERKPTDFFHNTLGDDDRNDRAIDIDLLFSPPIDAFNDDNDSGDEISRNDDGDGSSNAVQRPRRERKKTDFYHNVYSTALASADSSDEEVEELLSDEDGNTCPEPAPVASALPARREPRRIRVAERKPLVAKRNVDATVASSGDDWTAEQLDQLSAAMGSVEPTSASFWHDVASLVDERTESECRFKWFSIAKTPMPKLTKRSCAKKGAIREQSDDEDDIFNSSPMRGFFVPDGNDESNQHDAAVFMNHDVGSAIKMGAKSSAVASNSNFSTMKRMEPNFRPKAGYKMYLQNLKRDVARAQKEVPSRKGQSKLSGKGPRTLSETVYDSDVDVNVRLTPGGTLKVKSQYEEDEDDFWGAEYDAEDEEEI